MKKRVSITIEEDIFNEFQKFCRANGMKVSSRIEMMVDDFIKHLNQSQKNGKK